MSHKLEDLIDIKLVQELQDKLNVIYSFPSAIIDNDGKVLTAVAWQDICTKFHRINPESEKECIKSDQYILEHIHEANPAVSYKCPHGMIDNATPIIIDGKHYGNFFTGQFFLEKPDLEFFKKQAVQFGFDEKEYLEAVKKVPIWTKEKLHHYLDFIKGFIEIIAGIGLKNLKEIEANKKIKESEERYKTIVQNTSDWVWEIDEHGKYSYCSDRVVDILGYNVEEILGKARSDLMTQVEGERFSRIFQNIVASKNSIKDLENWCMHKDGHMVYLLTTGFPILDEIGNVIGYRGADKDITELKREKEKLNLLEQRSFAWLENSPVCTKIVDLDFNLQYMSSAGVKGLKIDDITPYYGKPYPFYFYPESFKSTMSGNMIKAKVTGEVITQEAPVVDVTGNEIWFHSTIVPVKDDYGVVEYLIIVSLDTTKRKKAEDTLQKQEEQYRTVINSVSEGIILQESDGRIVTWNTSAERIFGITAKEIVGRLSTEIIWNTIREDGSVFPAAEHPSIITLETGKPCNNIVMGVINLEGAITWININTNPLFKQNEPKPYAVVISFIDITERKKKEEIIVESNQFKKQIINSAQEGIIVYALDLKYKVWNPFMEELSGIPASEVLGKHPLEMFPFLKDAGVIEVLERALKGEICEAIDFPFEVKATGRKGWTSDKTAPLLNAKNEIIGVIATVRDITERKQIEEQYRVLFENSGTSNVIIDKNGVYLMINSKAAEQFGLSINEIVGKSMFDFLPKDTAQLYLERNQELLNSGGYREYEDSFILNGENKTFVIVDKCLQDIAGHNNAILSSSVDITERKLAEVELEKYRNHLEELVKVRTAELERANELLKLSVEKEKELNEMKSRFISTTSHEFRTPLTSVLSSTELLQRFGSKWSDEKKDEHFNRIIISIDYLTHLLDDILTLNRADTGKVSFNPEKLNLQQFANECLLDAELLLTDKHELKFNYKSKQKEFQLDPKLMRFVFNNLLSNAIKYSPQGGDVTLQISSDKKYLSIEVSDEGIGIQPEDLHKIFDAFYRTKHTDHISGTGLGLTILKRSVELHNGEITVESVIGKGTTFKVNIPFVPAT